MGLLMQEPLLKEFVGVGSLVRSFYITVCGGRDRAVGTARDRDQTLMQGRR